MRFMRSLSLSVSLALISPLAVALVTEGHTFKINYEELQLLRVERSHSHSMRTTVIEFEVDGEIRDMSDSMPAIGASLSHTFTDNFMAASDGEPTHIVRTFGEWKAFGNLGDESSDLQATPAIPAYGLRLEIKMKDGEQRIKVLEGEAPENDAFMEIQPMQLCVQGLLPTEGVKVEGTWELESEAIRQAIDDLSIPHAPQDRGMLGYGGPGRGNITRFIGQAEWTGEGKLTHLEAEFEDQKYALIELTMEAEGDLPQLERRGQGRAPGMLAAQGQPSGEAKVTIQGKLYYSLADQRPVALMLAGEIETSSDMESEFRGRPMTEHQEKEGEMKVTVRFTALER